MRRNHTFWIVAMILLSTHCEQKDLLPATQRSMIDSLMREANVTGLQLSYFEGENAVHHEFGYRNRQDSTEVTPNTIFEAASLSKQVTALLALRLIDAGKLNLQQLVTDIYEEPRLQNEPLTSQITVAHLLSHSSGLPNWGGNELQLDFEPGSQWQYSGEGYVLLSKVMEQVMAKSFEDLTEAWVFEPLG
ncbi:MAG: serine hydrolase domain-containing protein, partial [Bacteroidota bacterium]